MNPDKFIELKTKQSFLDDAIFKKHNLVGKNLIKEKVAALEVELSEFANEVRFFKYWSLKGMNREKALIEFVDGLHFFLSLANDLGVTRTFGSEVDEHESNWLDAYFRCKRWVYTLYYCPDELTWHVAFSWFWAMGEKAGFTEEEIYQAYLSKNKINYERQEIGY